jgi:hypothetical protein
MISRQLTLTLAYRSPNGVRPYAQPSSGGANSCQKAPNNGPTPQQPKKPPCNPATRIGGVVEAFDGFQTAGAAFATAGIHVAGAVLLVGGGCLDPTPSSLSPA